MPQLLEEEGVKAVRKTVTYCSYGGKFRKATDIWTNLESWEPRPCCKGVPGCHLPLSRHLEPSDSYELGIIPLELIKELLECVMSTS